MKMSRIGLLGKVKKLQGELYVLVFDASNYKEVSRKKTARDEVFAKYLIFVNCTVLSCHAVKAIKQKTAKQKPSV